MFDVMIVDDDYDVIESLKSMIMWNQLPIKFCCEATDGETARELYSLYRPKIIVTDINIPVLSGLDLIEELKKEDPDLLFVVITGYTDFELARRSLNLDAFQLISKPILPDTINKSLASAAKYLDEKREEQKRLDSLQDLLASNIQKIREAFLANLLQHAPQNPELIPMKLKQLQLDWPGPEYLAAVVVAQPPMNITENVEGLLILLLENLKKSLQKLGATVSGYVDAEFHANCIVSIPHNCTDNSIEGTLIRLGEQMLNVYGMKIATGVGMHVMNLADLHQSYRAALTAIDNMTVLGSDNVLFYTDLKQIDGMITLPEQLIPYLLANFREGNLQVVETTLRSHIHKLQQNDSAIRIFCFEYLTCISNEVIHCGLALEQINEYTPLITGLFHRNDYQCFLDDILKMTAQMYNAIVSKREVNSNHLIAMAKDYIRQNLSDQKLDLEKICNHIGLSRCYFSRLFHQAEGISFAVYLKMERIKKAKKLLRTTNLRVFEISEQCGFSNAKYFSYVFKQVVGEKPLDYQKKTL